MHGEGVRKCHPRFQECPHVDVWAIQLQDCLPRLPIPLVYPDSDIAIDLGAIVHEVYDRGAFSRRLDYSQPPPPPELSAQEHQWLQELLKSVRTSR